MNNKVLSMPSAEKILAKIKDIWNTAAESFRADPLRGWMFICTMGLMAMAFLLPIVEWRGKSLLNIALPLVSIFFAGVLTVHKRLVNGVASALLLAFAAWFTVTRLLLGDDELKESLSRVGIMAFMAVMLFNLPFFFNTKSARHKLRAVAADMCIGFCLLTAVLSILVIVFRCDIKIGASYDLSNLFYLRSNRLFCYTEYPTIIAQIMCIGVGLAIMRAMETRSKLLIAFYVVSAALIFAVMSMTDTRASNLVASCVIAGAAGLIWFRFMRGRLEQSKRLFAIKITAGVMCGVIALFAANAYVDLSREVLEHMGNRAILAENEKNKEDDTVPGDENSTSASDGSAQTDSSVHSELSFSDRGVGDIKEVLSLNFRTVIFKQAWQELKENPGIALFGSMYSEEKHELEGVEWQAWNWHNSYIEVIFETGAVGLGLIVAFVVVLLIRMFKVFFGSFDRYSMSDKFVVAIPAALLVLSMVEPTLFCINNSVIPLLIYMMFILWSGMIISGSESETE